MQVTISRAAKMAGVSRATIYNDIDSGTLSVERGAKDRKMINIAELERVYKTLQNPDSDDGSKGVKSVSIRKEPVKSNNPNQIAVLQERLEAERSHAENLQKLLDKEQEERRREREGAKEFEEYFKTQLENQRESIKNFTKLLEDQRSSKDHTGDEWKKAMASLEARIVNQETGTREAEEKTKRVLRQNSALKKALEAEKNKTFWQKLFG